MKVKITGDSTCDLSPALLEQYDIGVTPLYVVRDGQAYKDGLEITPDDIYAHVNAGGAMCSTAAVSVADYVGYFSEYLKTYDAIVHINISSEFSACYQNALLASQELGGRVYPVDSRNLSTGSGHLALDAAELAAEGLSAPEIQAELNARKDKLDVSFLLDTLKYLHKGGRCSAVAVLGANLLNLKPCIEVKDGRMGVGKKYRGSMGKCLVQYVQDRLAGRNDIDTRRIFITHSGSSPETIEAVRQAVERCQTFEKILITRAGCTISNHCGPNTLGILYFHK